MSNILDKIETSRRDFMKIIFATTTSVAVSGAITLWPETALTRPVSKPFNLALDDSSYLVDPSFDFSPISLPTHRERLSLEGLSGKALKNALNKQISEIDDLISDPDNWTLDEVEWWLDTVADVEDFGAWQVTGHSPYKDGLEIYQHLSREDAHSLGLELVEGDTPGSSFVGVAFYGDVAKLNQTLEMLGMNLVVTSSV